MIPAPVIREHEGFLVVRDDLLPGGSKVRAAVKVITGPPRTWIYTSPASGYAQLALAIACRHVGHQAIIFTPARKGPSEVWVACGSGLLTLALTAAWPFADVHAVTVGMEPHYLPATAIRHDAPEKFAAPAKALPPWPTVPDFDAKTWQFIRRTAQPGALIWNVAGPVA